MNFWTLPNFIRYKISLHQALNFKDLNFDLNVIDLLMSGTIATSLKMTDLKKLIVRPFFIDGNVNGKQQNRSSVLLVSIFLLSCIWKCISNTMIVHLVLGVPTAESVNMAWSNILPNHLISLLWTPPRLSLPLTCNYKG